MTSVDTQVGDMREAMRRGYDRLIEIATSQPFRAMVEELFERPRHERPDFVTKVVLVETERGKRGVQIPADVLVQRSSFGDRRPTLFCIKTFLPEHLQAPWQNVNITIDDVYDEDDIPRDRSAWRPALTFDKQAELIGAGLSPRQIAEL